LLESDIDPSKLQFDVFIDQWTIEGIQVSLNFTDPMLISQSKGGDRVLLNFKNPFLFVSQKNGMQLDMSNAVIAFEIPRQVPLGVDLLPL